MSRIISRSRGFKDFWGSFVFRKEVSARINELADKPARRVT